MVFELNETDGICIKLGTGAESTSTNTIYEGQVIVLPATASR